MPSVTPGARALLAVALVLTAVAVAPASALAELKITGATLDGAASTNAPPGSVMTAHVTGSGSSGDPWRGTSYGIGGQPTKCVAKGAGSGAGAVDFNVTAPGTPGNYDAGYTARGGTDCGGSASPEFVVKDALRVTKPGPNPDLPPRCGINVMLVLDKSGSIASSGQTETVRKATRAFLTSLAGTGAKVSIVDFSSSAGRPVGYTTVTAASIANTFEPYLQNQYKPSGYTNWQAAFKEVRTANSNGPIADLTVFITDGDPTARTKANGDPETGLTEGAVAAMRPAAAEADLVKGQGSHVFALGVGAAVTKADSADRLTAVSGFDEYPDTPFGEADYTLVQNFDDLAKALRQIAIELCAASVTVTKYVDEGDGSYEPDPGWRFTADVTMSDGDYRWLQPAPPPETGETSAVTNDDGVAVFQWKPSNATASSTVSLNEDQQPGYEFVDATCQRVSQRSRRRTRIRAGTPVSTITVQPGEYAKCVVRNRVIPGTIEIEKQANPEGATAFPFAGSLGEFSLVDDGSGTGSSRIFAGLPPGTYTVSELVPDDWSLTGVACTPAGAAVITGPETLITLGAGGSVVCTYADTRVEPPPPPPPVPPEPPAPPAPPAPPTPGGGVLPYTSENTTLAVVKRVARTARVGERIRFSLTVTNTGDETAHGVRLVDIPPAAVRLAGLSTARRVRIVRGNAVWRIGALEPGESRTVRGRVRIKAGTPGRKRNWVVATAIDAPLAADRADTRVRARALPIFTG